MSNQNDEGGNIQQLRDAAERGAQAARENEQLKRDLAMAKAGVQTDTPLGALFVQGYQGELDPEMVKAAWQAVAPAPAPVVEAPPAGTPTPEQIAETQQRRALSTGGAGDTPHEEPKADPLDRGFKDFQEGIAKGERRETAAAAVFGSLIKGAVEGDQRATWNGWTDEQLQSQSTRG